jgi:PAS domain S-box-containing protein
MNAPLKVVIIDDNADDRSLVVRELRREFRELQITEISDQDGFDAALERPANDLVVTDYDLRWTDGLTLARALKERWPDCPIIMFTGSGSEEIAVQAMKLGLQDYLLKAPGQFGRLGAAARAVLRQSAHRRELREAESRYSNLFNSIPVGLFTASPSGEIQDANPALASMTGLARASDLAGKTLGSFFVDAREYEKWRTSLERSGEAPQFEAQMRRPDGRICWVNIHARAIRHPKTRQLQYEGSIEDITQRKVAQQERENLIVELREALGKVKTLSGLLPICASCKKIRDDHGYWNQIEVYIQEHSDAAFTHSFCPDCALRLYPEVFAGKEL